MIKRLFLNDKFILGLIIINSITLFLSGYTLEKNELFLSLIDNLITTLFLIELIIKFNEFGIKKYFKSNWNKLDFILVALSLPALTAFVLNISIIDISFLLVFRVLRVFKAFRFFKFIPNVKHLATGIQKAFKASIFIFIGFIIYIFIIGILSYYLFQSSESEYFKDPIHSLYSTFKLFTVEGWFDIPESLTINYTKTEAFFTYIYFIFIVLTGGIFGLSLVNSIFVDSMVSDNNDEIEKKIDILDSKINELIKNTKK